MKHFISLNSLLRAVFLILALSVASPALAATPVSGVLSGNTVWTKAESPYIVSGVSVPAGSTLTIEPGVIVKMRPQSDGNNPLHVFGTLTIGTPDAAEQVVITSLADDLVGGDTNGDGDATTAHPGDWRNITAEEGGVVRIFHTTFRYGGAYTGYDYTCNGYCAYGLFSYGQLFNHGGTITVDSSTFTRSLFAQFAQSSGTASIAHSNLLSAPTGVQTTGGTLTLDHNHFSTTATGMNIGSTMLSLFSNTFTDTPQNSIGLAGSTYTSDGRNTSNGTSLLLSGDLDHAYTIPAEGFTAILGSTRILSTGALTFAPGSVIKITPDTNILVEGTLSIGSATSSVWSVVTSLKDDTIGGDSNKEGAATLPAQGDWRNIRIEVGGTLQMAHTEMRYGGASVGYDYTCNGYCGYASYASGQLFNHGGTLVVDDSRFTNAIEHIYMHGGTASITNTDLSGARYRTIDVVTGDLSITGSSLHDTSMGSQGLNVQDGASVAAIENWWGDASGPSQSTNASGTGVSINGSASFTPWLTAAPSLSVPTFEEPSAFVPGEVPPEGCIVDCNSNVLFLPGLEASRLYWTDPSCILINCENQLWEPNRPLDVANLYLDVSGGSVLDNVYTKDAIDTILYGVGGDIYRTFIQQLQNLKASKTIADAKILPYDWRMDPRDIVSRGVRYRDGTHYMVDDVHELASSSKTKKVTIVAHSNGGLVAKVLVDTLARTGEAGLVDKIIFIASPQLGTPEAIGALLHGDEQAHKPIVSQSNARGLGENMKGAYNLLPSAEYFNRVSDPVANFSNAMALNCPFGLCSSTIENRTQLEWFLEGAPVGRIDPVQGDIETPNVLPSALIASSTSFHDIYDSWQPPVGIKVVQIVGWGIDTVKSLEYWTVECRWFDRGCTTGETLIRHAGTTTMEGDGTVVWASAVGTDVGDKYYVNLADEDNIKHANITEFTQFQQLFVKILTNTTQVLPEHVSITKPEPSANDKRLRMRVLSPVSLDVYDSLGRHTGLASTSGDGVSDFVRIDEEIPGSYYREFGEGKYIGLPAVGTQRVVLNGLGSGTFTFEASESVADKTVQTITYKDIPVSSSTVGILQIDTKCIASTSLALDLDGDGTIDTTLSSLNKVDDALGYVHLMETSVQTMLLTKETKKLLLNKLLRIERLIKKDTTADSDDDAEDRGEKRLEKRILLKLDKFERLVQQLTTDKNPKKRTLTLEQAITLTGMAGALKGMI